MNLQVTAQRNPGSGPGWIGVVTDDDDAWLRQHTDVRDTKASALDAGERLKAKLQAEAP